MILATAGARRRNAPVSLRSLTLAETVDAAVVERTNMTAALTDLALVTGGERVTTSNSRLRLLGYNGATDIVYRSEAHSWEFAYTGSALAFRIGVGSPTTEKAYRIYVDGSPTTADFIYPTGDTQHRIDLPAGTHTIRLDLSRVALQAIDTTPSSVVSATRPRTKVYMLGDSWVAGASFQPRPVTTANGPGIEHMAFLTGRLLDASMVIGGYGGTGYVSSADIGNNYSGTARVDRIVNHAPDYLIVFGSINDGNDERVGGYATLLFDRIAGELPNCKIVVVGVQDWGQVFSGTDASPTLTAAAAAAPNVIAYVQPLVENWVPAGDSTINNTAHNTAHLTVYGNRYYAEKIRDVVMAAVG